MGLLSIGLTSIVYYAGWGWQPTRPTSAGAQRFCANCIASTLDTAPPSTMTHNFVGTQFLGGADRCRICGSTVKTLWFVFLLPLVPFSSYRILPVGEATVIEGAYLGRKTNLNVTHIVLVYLIVLAILGPFIYLATR
jgi:hypothetical protein